MNQDNKQLVFTPAQLEILEKVKFMCYDIYITTDNQVFSLKLKQRKEKLIGGSYCY